MGGERNLAADQQDRCSDQRHLWRRGRGGLMACQCGAIHPNDRSPARLMPAARDIRSMARFARFRRAAAVITRTGQGR